MAADPNGFDYFRRGEPLGIKGKVDNTGFDYFRGGETLPQVILGFINATIVAPLAIDRTVAPIPVLVILRDHPYADVTLAMDYA